MANGCVVFVHCLFSEHRDMFGFGLATIGECIAQVIHIKRRTISTASAAARCNKWPAAEESRLRQKGDAEPFLCGGPDTFCVDRNNASSKPRCLSSSAYYSRGDSVWSGGCPATHRISRACLQSVHGLIESQAHYFLLPLPDPLRPPHVLPPFLPLRTTD